MNSKDAKRILDLSRQWQDARCWLSAYHHADLCREHEHKGHAIANVYQDLSRKHFERATQSRQFVDARHAEISELENLLRDHAPKLFGLIPAEVNFWNSPSADLSPWLNAMREIESETLALVPESTPAAAGTTPNGSVEDRALAVLVLHPEWSNSEIAAAVGTHLKYLSSKNCSKFKAARAAIRSTTIPSGSKTKLGSLEAVGDDDLDFDAMDERMRNKR